MKVSQQWFVSVTISETVPWATELPDTWLLLQFLLRLSSLSFWLQSNISTSISEKGRDLCLQRSSAALADPPVPGQSHLPFPPHRNKQPTHSPAGSLALTRMQPKMPQEILSRHLLCRQKDVWPEGKKFCDTVCEYLEDMVKIQVHLPAILTNSSAGSLGTSVFSSGGQGARQEHPGDFPCAKGCSGKCQRQRDGGSEDPERAVESRDDSKVYIN